MASNLGAQLDLLRQGSQTELRRDLKDQAAEQAQEGGATPGWMKIPGVKPAMEAAEFVHEKVDVPWAAALTAPFSPPTSGTEGQSWLDRELAEYRAWKSPKFVKGAAELTMPLNLIPVGGAIGLGGRVAGRAGLKGTAKTLGTVGRGVTSAEMLPAGLITKGARKGLRAVRPTAELVSPKIRGLRPSKKDVPTDTVTDRLANLELETIAQPRSLGAHMETEFPEDVTRGVMGWSVRNKASRAVMGKIAPSEIADTDAMQLFLAHQHQRVEGQALARTAVASLEAMDAPKLFQLDEKMLVPESMLKTPDTSRHLLDVVQWPSRYNLTPDQELYVSRLQHLIKDGTSIEDAARIAPSRLAITDGDWVPRTVKERPRALDPSTGAEREIADASELRPGEELVSKMPGGDTIGKPREHMEARAGAAIGVDYDIPTASVEKWLSSVYRRSSEVTLREHLDVMARAAGEKVTALERMPAAIREATVKAGLRVSGLKKAERIVQDVLMGKDPASTIPGGLKASVIKKRVSEFENYAPGQGLRYFEALEVQGATRTAAMKELREVIRESTKAAKTELAPLRAQYKHAKNIETLPRAWEGTIRSGAFTGRVYPAEIARNANKMLYADANKTLQKLAEAAAVPRTLMTGMDFGVTQLHLMPMAFRNPRGWGKAMEMQFKGFADPTNVSKYVADPNIAPYVREMNQFGTHVAGVPEYMQAAGGTGRLLGKIPGVGKTLEKGVSKFESSFTGALTVGQVETYKALRGPLSKQWSQKELSEMNAFVRNITGTLDSRLLGVPAGQRAAEASMLMFAPRYTRSLFAVWSRMLRGGMTQKEAVRTMGQFLGGSMGLYYAIATMAGQEPKLNPTKGDFMTIRVKDTNVGIGSGHMAMMRFMANVVDAGISDPARFGKVNPLEPETWRDNPFAKFVRGRTSVLSGTGIDLLTGRTYLGEPLDTIPKILKEEGAGQMMPFWASAYLLDDPRPGITQLPAEMFGLRAWEKTYYQHRTELQERYSEGEWANLTKLEQKQIVAEHPDLQEAIKKAEIRTAEFGGVKEKTWFKYKNRMEDIKQTTAIDLENASNAVEAGRMTAKEFRERTGEIFDAQRAVRESIERDPEFKTVMEFFDDPIDKSDMNIEDIAFDEYMSEVYAKDLEDEFGIYDYDAAADRKDAIRVKYGPEVYSYIEERMQFGKDEPPMMQLLRKARTMLEPYWAVRDTVLRQQGVSNEAYDEYQNAVGRERLEMLIRSPHLKQAERRISQMRSAMRQANPTLDRYYRLFYA